MRLESLILENFRAYGEEIRIAISDLTAFIGENDVGKSTVLDALDAFFNDVIDPQDVNTRSGQNRFRIGCIFSDLPDAINLDAQSTTTLSDEYLLNSDGKLEIHKLYRTTATKAEPERIYARAFAPLNDELSGLLFKKRDQLKVLVESYSLDADRRRNAAMRTALYQHFESEGTLTLGEREVELDRPKDSIDNFQDARRIWRKLNDRHLPVYSLFRAEQVHGDKERAVRSPLDTTLKNALKELDDQLAALADHVQDQVKATTDRTLARLQEDYPEIARTLIPEYKRPTWFKAFDLDVLRGDDDVPLNKRGTGVRRLVVLAFFQAEAEQKRQERADGTAAPPVIYGIEEPETSQHPNFQRNIIEAFLNLSEAGDQVLLTTHVPGLAELLPVESIRYVDRPEGNVEPRIRSGADDRQVLLEAANSLGVLPSAIPTDNPQLAVWVEGDSDVWVLEDIAKKLAQASELPHPLNEHRIVYLFGGGGDQLKSIVNGQYLDALRLPQFYLRDSDRTNPSDAGKELPAEILERVRQWEEESIGYPIAVVKTNKREIENYLCYEAVDRIAGCAVNLSSRLPSLDLDFDQVSKSHQDFWQALTNAKHELDFQFPETTRRGVAINYRRPKHVICGVVIPEMTLDEIRTRCSTTDDPNDGTSEIDDWFTRMARLVEHST